MPGSPAILSGKGLQYMSGRQRGDYQEVTDPAANPNPLQSCDRVIYNIVPGHALVHYYSFIEYRISCSLR